MSRSLAIALLLLAGTAAAQDAPTYESLVKKHQLERAEIAHVKTRSVALRALEKCLGRQSRELHDYADDFALKSPRSRVVGRGELAPVASRQLASARAAEIDHEMWRLLLDRQAVGAAEDLASDDDVSLFAVLVEHAAGESQERLVSVLDARAKTKNLTLKGPGALVLEGAEARALGVRWGKVELLVARDGSVRGVDLVGDERQNLLANLMKEVPK